MRVRRAESGRWAWHLGLLAGAGQLLLQGLLLLQLPGDLPWVGLSELGVALQPLPNGLHTSLDLGRDETWVWLQCVSEQ